MKKFACTVGVTIVAVIMICGCGILPCLSTPTAIPIPTTIKPVECSEDYGLSEDVIAVLVNMIEMNLDKGTSYPVALLDAIDSCLGVEDPESCGDCVKAIVNAAYNVD